MSDETLPAERLMAEILGRTRTSVGRTLGELAAEANILLVLLRHSGCIFCREALSDLSRQREAIEQAGARIVLAHMESNERFAMLAARYGLGDVPLVSDPSRGLYRDLGLGRGTLRQLFGMWVWRRGLEAFLRGGHRPGALRGDALQMPGVFLLSRSRVVSRFVHLHTSSRPDYLALVRGGWTERG